MMAKVRDALSQDSPVLMWLRGPKKNGLNHWVLAIGKSEDSIYMLDPACELPHASYWNAVLKRQDGKHSFAYRYLNYSRDDCDVQANEIVIVKG